MMKLPITTCPQLWSFSSYCIPQSVKDRDVVIISYCLAWRSVQMLDSTFIIKKKSALLSLGCTFFGRGGDPGDFHWEVWAIVSGS
jgi:hypothetical protein